MPDADAVATPTKGRIVTFTEGALVAPAMVTKVETPMEGVVPAVSLTVFCEGGIIYRHTVAHESTFDVNEKSPSWSWPERT